MAHFLTTQGHIILRIEDTISQAKEYIYFLTSEFSILPSGLFQKLWEASSRGVKVFIIYPESKISDNDLLTLQKFKHLSLYCSPSLRYNATFSEKEVIMHSLCVTSSEDALAIHSGVHYKRKYASEMYEQILSETKEIRNNATKMVFHQGRLEEYLKVQEVFIKTEEEKKTAAVPGELPNYGSKKLTAKEKQKLILDTFAVHCPECVVKVEDSERIRVHGKGVVVFTNKEKIEVIFVRYDNFNARKEDFKAHILKKHPELPIWCTYNRITLNVDKADEIINLFTSIRDSLLLFSLV
jgi:phosphatidylserine/phosphatidylglycerophosphate/cardiolipin synthase-like enzyme